MSRESEGPFDVKIIASGNASFPYTIQVAAMNIEATQPFDYVFSPIVLTFQPDEVEKSITVPIVDDIFDELDETFKLIITVPNISRDAGITEGEINVTTLLIVDDDGKCMNVLLCTYVCTYVCVFMYVCMCVCVHVRTCVVHYSLSRDYPLSATSPFLVGVCLHTYIHSAHLSVIMRYCMYCRLLCEPLATNVRTSAYTV